jgi:hypothetical protein
VTYTDRTSEAAVVAAGSHGFVEAICPTDTFVVGGGYSRTAGFGDALLVATDSFPVTMVDGREAWHVLMYNMGTQEGSFYAIAYRTNVDPF